MMRAEGKGFTFCAQNSTLFAACFVIFSLNHTKDKAIWLLYIRQIKGFTNPPTTAKVLLPPHPFGCTARGLRSISPQ